MDKPETKLFTIKLTAAERAALEEHRKRLGLRSQTEVIRYWIADETWRDAASRGAHLLREMAATHGELKVGDAVTGPGGYEGKIVAVSDGGGGRAPDRLTLDDVRPKIEPGALLKKAKVKK